MQDFDALYQAQNEFAFANLQICKFAPSTWKCPSPQYKVQFCSLENSLSTSNHASKSCRNFKAVVQGQNQFYSIGPWCVEEWERERDGIKEWDSKKENDDKDVC